MTQLLARPRTAAPTDMDTATNVAHRALGEDLTARDAHEADLILARWLIETVRERERRPAA